MVANKSLLAAFALAVAAVVALAGCGGAGMMTGPRASAGAGATALTAVSPRADSVGVSLDAQIVMRFSHGMGVGMERLLSLHAGDINGPVVPMECVWSGDRTTLTCTPSSPLKPKSPYTLHMGGGMVDGNGNLLDWDDMAMMGWLPAMGSMMSGSMMSDMMGPGWQATNGTYGVFLTFTTAG